MCCEKRRLPLLKVAGRVENSSESECRKRGAEGRKLGLGRETRKEAASHVHELLSLWLGGDGDGEGEGDDRER